MKRQKIQILTLFVALVLSISAMVACLLTVSAANEVAARGVFTALQGAAMDNDEASAGQERFLTYKLSGSDESVVYQKNLALKWRAFDDAENPAIGGANSWQYFELTFAFADTDFTSFTISMETTQFSMSKAGKTVNTIKFTKDGSQVKASVNGAEAVNVDASKDITVSLSEETGKEGFGEFVVSIQDHAAAGKFTNIGKYYAAYASSSATTPITPLTFKAEVPEDGSVRFAIKSMNGQSFKLNDSDQITDDTAPVLVVDKEIKRIVMGEEVDFEAVAIDVCSTATTTMQYYIATSDAEAPSFDADKTLVGYSDLSSDKKFFDEDFEGAAENGVSIAYKLSDGNSNDADSNIAYVFVEWYAEEVTASGYIEVVNPNSAVLNSRPEAFGSFDVSGNWTWMQVENEEGTLVSATDKYQAAVTNAALQEDGTTSIQVGSGAYYYVPSLKEFVRDDNCGYSDMEFTVYYRFTGKTSTDTQQISGDFDELRFEIAAPGYYEFRIVPKNMSGKTMAGVKENGEKTEISSSNVWDVTNLVTFSFTVDYNGPVIENPEGNETGYVDVVYSVSDFDIVATSGYAEEYQLYYLELKAGVGTPTLAQVNEAEKAGSISQYGEWKEIEKYDSDKDSDDGDNAYSWNPDSSLSFVPQKIGFYKVGVTVYSDNFDGVSSFKVINVSSESESVRGETHWLQNNILSVVFLSVGVLCLIGIVVLLLIKPKDKAAVEAEKARKAELKEKRSNRK